MSSHFERATNEIVPAVRAIIAKELSGKYKMKEEEIARMLNVAQAAVSKYISDKYSDRIKEIEASIDKSLISGYIEKMAQGRAEYANVCMCTICRVLNQFNCRFSAAEKAAQV